MKHCVAPEHRNLLWGSAKGPILFKQVSLACMVDHMATQMALVPAPLKNTRTGGECYY